MVSGVEPFLTTETELYASILVGIGGEDGQVPNDERVQSTVRLVRKSSEREHTRPEPDELMAELRKLRHERTALLNYCSFVDDQNAKDSRRTLHTRIIRRTLGEPEEYPR